MPDGDKIDYKTKAEELAKQNVELTAQVKSLEAVASQLRRELDKWMREFDQTVAIHNQVRDKMITMLTNALSLASNNRFFDAAELEQQRSQAAAIKAQLLTENKQKGER